MKVKANDLGLCGIEQLMYAGTVKFGDTGIGSGKKIFEMPHEAIITRMVAVVTTAFAGATSPALVFGTADDDDAYLAAGDITEGTKGSYSKQLFEEAGKGDGIYAKLTGTGTFTAGEADLYVFAVGIPEANG